MNSFLIALDCVTPVFLYMALGYAAKRAHFLTEEMCPALNRFTFRFLLSINMFKNAYAADLSGAFSLRPVLFLVLFYLVSFLLSWPLFKRFVSDRRARGALIQTTFRSNIGIVGITMGETLMGVDGLASMAIAVAVIVPFSNLLAVSTLELLNGEQVKPGKVLRHVLTNPLILGAFFGFLINLSPFRLPGTLEAVVSTLAKTGTTLALIVLGASFRFARLSANPARLVWGNLIRLVLSPAAALALAVALGMRGGELAVVLLTAGSPFSASAVALASSYDSDVELTGQLVVTSSLLCCFTLFLWIAFFKEFALI